MPLSALLPDVTKAGDTAQGILVFNQCKLGIERVGRRVLEIADFAANVFNGIADAGHLAQKQVTETMGDVGDFWDLLESGGPELE